MSVSVAVLFVLPRIVGKSEYIVDRDLIKMRQAYEYLARDISLPELIITVHLLRAVQVIGQLALLQIPVLSQIPNSRVHDTTSIGISIVYRVLLY